jgi:hypothetical protein
MKTRLKLSTQAMHAVRLFCCLSQLAREDLARTPRRAHNDDRACDDDRAHNDDLARDILDIDVSLQFFAPMLGDSCGVRSDATLLQELRDRRPTRIPYSTAHEKRAASDWLVQCALIWVNLGDGCLLRILDNAASPAVAAAHVSIRNQLDLIDGMLLYSSSLSQPLRDYVAGRIGARYVRDDVTDQQGLVEWAESGVGRGVAVAS